METYKEFLVFSPDYRKLIAFVSTENNQNSFTTDIDWNYPLNGSKPKLFLQNNENTDNDEDENKQNGTNENSLNNIAVSTANSLLAFTANDKSLFLMRIDGESTKTISRRSFLRTSSCIRFSKCGNFLFLADKTGDIFEYQCDEDNINSRGRWIFGHISQILDLAIAPSSNYIITSDRDEKIRVTHYPKVHEINSYCLGHKEFVSALSIISDHHLLSISGDKSLKFWNFIDGKELQSFSYTFVPVLLKTIVFSPNSGLICVSSIANTVRVINYTITNDELTVKELCEKQYKSDIEIAVQNQEFYIEYIRDDDSSISGIFIDRVKIENGSASFQRIFNNSPLSKADMNVTIFKSFHVPLLFKNARVFDNIKHYNDKKRARIESRNASKNKNKN